MNQYRLQIELSFTSRADADKIMDACEPLVIQTGEHAHEDLDEAVKQNIKEYFEESQQCISESIVNRKEITDCLSQVNATVAGMRNERDKTIGVIEELKNISAKALELTSGLHGEILTKLKISESLIDKTLEKLNSFDGKLEQMKHLMEASTLIHDMIDIQHNIVSGGTVKMIWRDPSKEGEKWFPVKNWTFDRKMQ